MWIETWARLLRWPPRRKLSPISTVAKSAAAKPSDHAIDIPAYLGARIYASYTLENRRDPNSEPSCNKDPLNDHYSRDMCEDAYLYTTMIERVNTVITGLACPDGMINWEARS